MRTPIKKFIDVFVLLMFLVGVFFTVSLIACPAALAATNSTGNVETNFPTVSLPTKPSEYWTLIISVITPGIVYCIGKVRSVPRPLLPIMTPVIGIVLGLALNYASKFNLSWFDMAQAGALAVFIREAVNQAITKQLALHDGEHRTGVTPQEFPGYHG